MTTTTISAQNLIIGFGKAGKTLAAALSQRGELTILVEASEQMYGGTCINVGRIPSKSSSTKLPTATILPLCWQSKRW